MSDHPTESKRLLSHTIAEWACALKYEHLSPAAIQAAKLFWFEAKSHPSCEIVRSAL